MTPSKTQSEDETDAFRQWERSHNRDNYGRCDAFSAGIKHGRKAERERIKELINTIWTSLPKDWNSQIIAGALCELEKELGE